MWVFYNNALKRFCSGLRLIKQSFVKENSKKEDSLTKSTHLRILILLNKFLEFENQIKKNSLKIKHRNSVDVAAIMNLD